MSIDYNELAKDYDLTRIANINTINLFAAEMPLNNKLILDFGCGTGNFADAIKKLTDAEIYGVEPSDGMREKALLKGLDARQGDHTFLPFDDDFFDFVYMTDVIHHVPNIKLMFSEFRRVLKPNGFICILTESHKQLETRFWVKYFPATVIEEKKRYPDISDIVKVAINTGLVHYKNVVTDVERDFTVSEDFLKIAENKGFSMFRLIEEEDYTAGLAALKEDYENKTVIHNTHGETLIWLKKCISDL